MTNLCGLEINERSDYNFWSVDFSLQRRKSTKICPAVGQIAGQTYSKIFYGI